MKVLITGGAGFLGSNLSDKFIAENHNVTVIDDLSTGRMKNIELLLENSNFKFINHDVRNPFDIDVDLILNFACPASPIHYQSDPVKTMETNFIGIVNMLHLAQNKNARLVQASTSEVYGDPEISPQPESYWGNVNPIGLRSCYDEGKRAAETLCFDYRRQFSVDARIVRIFNTHGPRMSINDGRVVSNFAVQALMGEDITLYGDGLQTRSFCYVTDLIDGIFKMAMTESVIDKPINLGNPRKITMIELAELIIQITNSKSKLVFKPLPEDDPKQREPDINSARKILSWEPSVTLEEGVTKTVNYFETLLRNN